jgi:hypothetical protein
MSLPRRILFVTGVGGTEKHLRELLPALKANGFKVAAFCFGGEAAFRENIRSVKKAPSIGPTHLGIAVRQVSARSPRLSGICPQPPPAYRIPQSIGSGNSGRTLVKVRAVDLYLPVAAHWRRDVAVTQETQRAASWLLHLATREWRMCKVARPKALEPKGPRHADASSCTSPVQRHTGRT